jgi:hypothetical protein
MNDMQKRLLIAVGVIVLGMLLYPPYRVYGVGDSANTLRDTGYALIFELPFRAIVDIGTLLVQWVGVLIVGSIAFFLLKSK